MRVNMDKEKKKRPNEIEKYSHIILADENGNRIQPRWIEELNKLSPQKKAILKMKFEENNRQFEIKYNKNIN